MDDEGSIAEPEPLVGVGAGIDIAGGMEHQGSQRRFVEELETSIGNAQSAVTMKAFSPAEPGSPRCPVNAFERDMHQDKAWLPGFDLEHSRRRAHANLALPAILVFAFLQMDVYVAGAIIGHVMPVCRRVEFHRRVLVDAPGRTLARQHHFMHEADSLGVVGAQREHQPAARSTACLQFHMTDRHAGFELDRRAGVQCQTVLAGLGGHG